ncbi:MAG: hypothetical protein HYT87_18275 [Nitrospirae bacterium]|nr:hypothetical protein [Nitrospirota bacterium]
MNSPRRFHAGQIGKRVRLFALSLILPACAQRSCTCENQFPWTQQNIELAVPLTPEQAAMAFGLRVSSADLGVDGETLVRQVPGEIVPRLRAPARAMIAPEPILGAPMHRRFLDPLRIEPPSPDVPASDPSLEFRIRVPLPIPLPDGSHIFSSVLTHPDDAALPLVEASAAVPMHSTDPLAAASMVLANVNLPSNNSSGVPNLVQAFARERTPELGLDPVKPAGPGSDERISNIASMLSPHLQTAAQSLSQQLQSNTGASVPLTVDPDALTVPFVTPFLCESPTDESCATGRTLSSTRIFLNFGCDRIQSCLFECSKDGEAFAPCDAPYAWNDLSPGLHEFRVRAKDSRGEEGPAGALLFFMVGHASTATPIFSTVEPIAQYTQTPPSGTGATATFSFACDSVCLWSCSWDGLPFRACSSPYTLSDLPPGDHAFSVRAMDVNGTSSLPIVYSWSTTGEPTPDIPTGSDRPFDTKIDIGPPPLTQANRVTFTFGSSTVNLRYECSLDGGPYVPCTSPYVVKDLASGPHLLQVRAIGPSGRVEDPISHSWTVDSLAPAPPDRQRILVGRNAPGTTDTLQGEDGAVEGNSILKAWADGLLTTLIRTRTASADGSFSEFPIGDNEFGTLYLTATDAAGNQSAATQVSNDISPPSAGSISFTDGYYKVLSIPITFSTGTDIGTGIIQTVLQRRTSALKDNICSAYGPYVTLAMNPRTSPYVDSSAATSTCLQYQLIVYDGAGQHSLYASASTARTDTQAPSTLPVVNDGTGPDIDIQSSSFALEANWPASIDAGSGLDTYEACVSNSSSPGVCVGIDFTFQRLGNVTSLTRTALFLTEGSRYFVHVRARDKAGNTSPITVSDGLIPDPTPPAFAGLSTIAPESTTQIDLSWSPATDNLTAQGDLRYAICRSTTADGCSVFAPTCLTDPGATAFSDQGGNCGGQSLVIGARYSYIVRAMDEAGNFDLNDVRRTASTWGTHAEAVFTHAGDHACALIPGGRVKCWGRNDRGQIGAEAATSQPMPVLVTSLSGIVSLSQGLLHTCALMPDGSVRCWGSNFFGQLGDGSTADSPTPKRVTGLSNAVGVSGGTAHSCALIAGGSVHCWGANTYGQLGDGTTVSSLTPVAVTSLSNAVSVATGSDHSCAVLSDGIMRCWGANLFGQLGDGTTVSRPVPVAVSSLVGVVAAAAGAAHTCTILADGSTKCWGLNINRQLGDGTTVNRLAPAAVSLLSNTLSVTGGTHHTCALLANGTVACWGRGAEGQLANGTGAHASSPEVISGLDRVIMIAAGSLHTCALVSGGVTKCWGDSSFGQVGDGTRLTRLGPVSVENLVGPIGILARRVQDSTPSSGALQPRPLRESLAGHLMYHSCVLLSDRSAKCWGRNQFGQLGNGSMSGKPTAESVAFLSDAVGLTGGIYHTCAAMADGTVKCWGANYSGQVGDGTGFNRLTPVAVSTLTNAVSVAGGLNHSCAVLADGTAKCWGRNYTGELGDGTTMDAATPVTVSGLTGATGLTGGSGHTCALLSDGRAQCWGFNDNFQLGDGTTVNRGSPSDVTSLSNAVSISAGLYHTCALISDGTVKCWGRGADGQLGFGESASPGIPIAASSLSGGVAVTTGDHHTCVLIADGTIRCFGLNLSGQLGDGTSESRFEPVPVASLSGVVAVTTGSDHSCAMMADGKIYCWGSNRFGQLGDGSEFDAATPVQVQNLDAP